VEVTRVYGNLTRAKDTRDFLIESGAWNQILKFLDWDDQELLCTTVGILVNMMADWDKRVALKEGQGIKRYFTEISVPFEWNKLSSKLMSHDEQLKFVFTEEDVL
jgi:hypothetical protein